MTVQKILDQIDTPHKLRRLDESQLSQLADELRERIVEVVSKRGGHLASNLGIADLTVALHYVFDFSKDRLLWDVGHQCYAHKILTGRNESFDTLRQEGGISGFPSPSESEYDLFATGHAGTAISTAAGLAWADRANNADTKVVAVVGDASIVNGLSMEALNNAGMLKRQLLVILNDNSMAIDRTSGAMSQMLDRVRMNHTYADLKSSAENMLHHLPLGGEIADAIRKLKESLLTSIHGAQAFEALGFQYFGPIDGHDMNALTRVLPRLAAIDRPTLLHVHTQKGKGRQYAVEDPCRFHSPSAYTIEGGQAIFAPKGRPTWTQTFSKAMVKLGQENEKIVAITAAMPDGCGVVEFRKAFPERYIDVGISESHAVAMAAGMAKAGMRPIVAIYSTFMQRAIDQMFEEVALQNLPVMLCMDRAGLVGSDGAVHHGLMDISCLRTLPGMVLMAPADGAELTAAMKFGLSLEGPTAIRYPRDEVPESLPGKCPPFELGKARTVRNGDDATLLCLGTMVEPALAVAKTLQQENDLELTVVNARFAKPLDVSLISRLIASGKPMLVLEDHAITGGFGSAVMELASNRGLNASNVRLMGVPDRFIKHASRTQQLSDVGLDAEHIAATVKDMVLNPSDSAKQYL